MPKYICYPVRIESTGEIRLFNYEFDQSNMMIEDKILDDIYFKLDREGDYTVLDLFYSDADSPEMVAEDYFATELRKHIQNIYFVGDEYIQQPDKNTISFEFETNLYTVKLMEVRYDWLEGRIHDYYYQVYSYQDGMKSKELVIDGLFTGFDFSAIDELVWGEFEVEIPEFADGGLIAPNGKKSNLTPEQYKLVRTPEFKAWFGFWDLAINGKALDYHIPAVKDIAKRLKLSEPNAIKIAANFLSKQVDSEDVLIPMPSRKGFPTDTNDLAVAIAEMTGAKVFSCLIGKERESVYELKKQGKDVYSFNFQFELRCQFPKAKRYFIVDNVIGTGITMKNALLAIGVNAEPLVYAIDLKNISKVVDNQGEPLVVYHGGTKGINVFENKKGIYFTPFRNIADDFLKYRSGENGKIYDVFLKIKHPKTYDVINYNDIPKSESELNDNDGIIAEYVALEDGTNEGKQFVVFDSNQIKLADGTNTTFDSSNPDIRFAEGGEIKETYELTEENAWKFEYDLAEALGLRPTKSYHLVGGNTLLRIKGHSPNWENFVNDLELNENIDRIINVTVGDYNRRRFDTGLKTKLDEIESRYPDIDFVDIEINDGDDLDLSVAYVRHILYPEMMFSLGGDVQKRKVPKDFDSGDLPEFGQKVKGTDYIYVGHTTTTKFLPEILKHGLKTDAPQKSWDETSKGKIYFEVDPTNHKIYAQRATYRYGGDGVTLIVKVDKRDLHTDRDDRDLGARYKGQKEYYKNVPPEDIVGAWFHFGNIWVKKDDLAEYIRLFHDDDSTFSEGGEVTEPTRAEKIKQKVEQHLIDAEKRRKVKDVGRVEMSRKQQAAYRIISMSNIDELNEDEVLAFNMVKKDAIWPPINVEEQKNQGVSAGAAYIKVKIREALPSKPANSSDKRKAYVNFLNILQTDLMELKTVKEVKVKVHEYLENLYYITIHYFLYPEIIDIKDTDVIKRWVQRFLVQHHMSGYSVDSDTNGAFSNTFRRMFSKNVISDTLGKTFYNMISGGSEAAELNWKQAETYQQSEGDEQEYIEKVRKEQQHIFDRYRDVNKEIAVMDSEQFYKYLSARTNKVSRKEFMSRGGEEGYRKAFEREWNKAADKLKAEVEVPLIHRKRDDDWSWAIKKEKEEVQGEEDLKGRKVNTKEPLAYIKRVNGYKTPEPTPQNVVDYYGFSAYNFGKYVPDNERAEHAKHFIGAITDLAEILNIDIKQVHQLGKLGFGVGLKGHAGHLAAYYPQTKDINLVRGKGDGSVAHEWGHFFDNLLCDLDMKVAEPNFASEGDRIINDDENEYLLTEKFRAFDRFLNRGLSGSVNYKKRKFNSYKGKDWTGKISILSNIDLSLQTFFANYPSLEKWTLSKRSDERVRTEVLGWIVYKHGLDSYEIPLRIQTSYLVFDSSQIGSEYWVKKVELFARCFETYIFNKLAKANMANNYLAHDNYFSEGTPYPKGEELEYITMLFDEMIVDFKKLHNIGDFKPIIDERIGEEIIELQKDSVMPKVKAELNENDNENRMRMLALKAKADADALALLELEMEMQSGG